MDKKFDVQAKVEATIMKRFPAKNHDDAKQQMAVYLRTLGLKDIKITEQRTGVVPNFNNPRKYGEIDS